MAGSKGSSKGYNKAARSVGAAAASGKPNGAILNDDDNLQKHAKRFKDWAKGYRLKSNPMLKGAT